MNETAGRASDRRLSRRALALFNAYSYLYNFVFAFLEVMPQPIRRMVLRMLFRKLGPGGLIDYHTYFRYPSRMSFGRNVFVNHRCCFYGSSLAGVEINVGDDVAIGPHVKIFTASHDYATYDLKDVAGSVTIGANAWIGGGAIILPGVTIGEGAVIGAGSVVTRDVPAFAVAAGNPAEVIKTRVIDPRP